MANNKLIVRQKDVEARAKSEGLDFVTYPSNFDFNSPYDRVLNSEKRNQIADKQVKVIAEGGEFDQFLDNLNVGNSIKTKFTDMFYGKPLFALAIKSGANINFNSLKRALEAADGNYDKQVYLTDQFCAQLTMSAIQGTARDIYSAFVLSQNGKESKYSNSKSFYDFYTQMMNESIFEINTAPGKMPPIIEKLNGYAKTLNKQFDDGKLTPQYADQVFKLVRKDMENVITNSRQMSTGQTYFPQDRKNIKFQK